MPEELYRHFEQIGRECEQDPLELIKEAFRLYLAGHQVQREGGRVAIKENQWSQGRNVLLGGVVDLDDFIEGLSIEPNES